MKFFLDLNTLPFHKLVIITDTTVKELHGHTLYQNLIEQGHEVYLFSVPAGEESKTRNVKESLEDLLFQHNCGRDTTILALGGGVITDLAGFVAATYLRKVPLILIPTTLLAMVDAAIGGKTSVNTIYGKNTIGAFYQPNDLWIHTPFLETLPKKQFKNGMVEMLKAGLIADASFFFNLDSMDLTSAILRSIEIKQSIIQDDLEESGKRRLCNFGHTIGHALESATHYLIEHGEAVAFGIIVESYISYLMKYLSFDCFQAIYHVLSDYICETPPDLNLINYLCYDKKCLQNSPRFVLLEKIGSPLDFNGNYCSNVDAIIVKNALEKITNDLYPHCRTPSRGCLPST